MAKKDWIDKLNSLDPPKKNQYDKGGHTLLECMDYYKVNNLSVLSEEQLKEFYEIKVLNK